MHLELAAGDGVAQVAFQRVAGFQFRRHRFVVQGEAVPARRLGSVQRKVGLFQKLLPIAAVLRRHRDPDTGTDLHLVARQQERLGAQFRYLRCQIDRTAPLILALGLDDGEFVAPEPRQHVDVAHRRFETSRHLPQQRISGGMTKRIVDVLEAIKIDHEDRKRAASPAFEAIDLFQLLQKKCPVRKPGQNVGLRQLQHTPVRQRELARVAACKAEIHRKARRDDNSGRQHGQGAIVMRHQPAVDGGRGAHVPAGIADPKGARPVRSGGEGLRRARVRGRG